jgi:hypothetical protein
MTPAERTERRIAQPNFWNRQGENTLDRATAGLGLPRIKDEETRRAVIRAYNIVSADYFRDFSDRMTPPMHTPEEGYPGNRRRSLCLDLSQPKLVMRGLDPRIYALAGGASAGWEDVDGRIKSDQVPP